MSIFPTRSTSDSNSAADANALSAAFEYGRKIIYGELVLSWSSATVFGVSTGKTFDSTVSYSLNLASAFTKSLSTWAVGTGNGGKMSAAAMANSTTYHVYLIRKDSDGSIDVGFDVSATSPTMPVGYTYFKRIGSFRTNTSAQIIKFSQHGNMFRFDAQQDDRALAVLPNTTRNLLTVSAPENCIGVFNCIGLWVGAPAYHYWIVQATAETDSAASATNNTGFTSVAGTTGGGELLIGIDNSRQIAYRGTDATSLQLRIATLGWIDPLI